MGLAHEVVEMAGQRLYPFGVAEDHVVLADIDCRQQRPENGDRRRVEAAGVEEVDAHARVELFGHFEEVLHLFLAHVAGEARVVALAADEGVDLEEGQGDLVIRLGAAHPREAILGGADGLVDAAAEVGGVFPFEHGAGLEHVGHAGGDVADLVARGLLVPAEDLFVDQRAGRLGEREGVGDDVGGGFGAVGEAQEPVGGDAEGGGAFAHHLRVGQAGACALDELGYGRAVDAHRPGEARLSGAAVAHRLGDAAAKEGGAVALVDDFPHMVINITNAEKC